MKQKSKVTGWTKMGAWHLRMTEEMQLLGIRRVRVND